MFYVMKVFKDWPSKLFSLNNAKCLLPMSATRSRTVTCVAYITRNES